MKPRLPILPALVLVLAVSLIHSSHALEKGVKSLIEQLGHHRPAVRESAINKLVGMGTVALPALAEALQKGDETTRDSAALALARLGEPAVPILMTNLNDPREELRHAVIDALGRMEVPAERVVPAFIIALLTDKNAGIRQEAAEMLGAMGPNAKDAVPALIKALSDDESEPLRLTAAEALGKMGRFAREAIPVFASILMNDSSQAVRIKAAETLGRIARVAEEAISTLQLFLNDENVKLRQTVVRMFGQIGQPTEVVVPLLIGKLLDVEEVVRREVVMALKAIGEPAIPYLVDTMNGEQKQSRFWAAMTLGEIGPPAKETVPVLIEALADADVRTISAWSLGQIGPDAKEAVPALINQLNDGEFITQEATAEALGRIGPPAVDAVPGLIQLLNDENLGVRNQASIALGRIGVPAKAAVPHLIISILTDEPVRKSAIEALGDIGPSAQAGGPTLVKMLSDSNWEVRQKAVQSLWNIRADRMVAVPAIINALNTDDSEIVRATAAEVLGKIGVPSVEVVPALIEALINPHAKVHDMAVTSLEEIGAPAVPALIQTLNHERDYVRGYAAEMLGRIGKKVDTPAKTRITSALIKSSRNKIAPYQDQVIRALQTIGSPAVSFLTQSLQDSDTDVRKHAVYLLGEIGKPVGKIVLALVQTLNDEQFTVRVATQSALRRIGTAKFILFRIDLAFQTDLNQGDRVSEDLRLEFEKNGVSLAPNTTLSMQKEGSRWLLSNDNQAYTVWREDDNLYVSSTANIALLDHKTAERKKRKEARQKKQEGR
ncbi:MAG: HEAT repeat domain-containing protein [Candidatus Poribacteria bacterium]|nr:HEAT repeat domain-containing protein [Candidatus Poribacteria bacterium]